MEKVIVECDGCGAVLNEPADTPFERRDPCPQCGSLIRKIHIQLVDGIRPSTLMTAKLRNFSGKIVIKLKSFQELYRKLNKWQDTSYSVNKRDDKYDKIVTDPDTGEVIYECHEPLSDHQGCGTAKRRRKKQPKKKT